ncbi:uncharacterized protein LOC132637680 [Lycium barbarum]|uniref:uncharacterized protein LOC132637680 n=1 Tax=Lycium barbarum TaxID=112863 RepID=UPI00293F52A8|nr:uncharacterized protein LOC132637680 [Lycium barbarum]
MPIGKYAKWQKLLSEFDIVYVAQKAIKGQAQADLLAKIPVDEKLEPLQTFFPDEEMMFIEEEVAEPYSGWRLFFDGAVDYKGSGIRAVLKSETGQHYLMATKLNFRCTNNMAEYQAGILGLRMAWDMNIQELLFKITHRNSTADLPQMNGAIEAANKNIKRILRKMIDNYKNYHEQLPYALLRYRTTTRTSTEATPYLFIYGTEAVIPAELENPSLRIIQEAELNDAEWVRNRYEQLSTID